MDLPKNRQEAQFRADRIHLFRDELKTLLSEKVILLSPAQQAAIQDYHQKLLGQYSTQFGTDTTEKEKKISAGMLALTLLGGFAICAGVFFMFYQFWGYLSSPVKISILVLSPLVFIGLMEVFARRETTPHYVTLCALLALACFVLNLNVLGYMFNITPSPNALLVWGLFGVSLAYLHGLRLLLALGLLSIIAFASAYLVTFRHYYWFNLFDRPEHFIVAGAFIFCVPFIFRHRIYSYFPPVYRGIGLLSILFSVMFLSLSGYGSYLPWNSDQVETLYEFIGIAGSGVVLWVGIRSNFHEMANIGLGFLCLFFYLKMVSWFWDSLPRWMFFMLLGAITIGLLILLKKFRARDRVHP